MPSPRQHKQSISAGAPSRSLRVVACVMVALSVYATAVASAAEEGPSLGPLQHSEQLSDHALGGIRGRYLAQGRIVRFGVEMVSSWQTDAGQTYRAGATLNVGLDGKPQIRFVPSLAVTEPANAAAVAGASTHVVQGGAGLASVSGVVQSIQVAGDGNQVTNSATVTLTRTGAPSVASEPTGPTQMSRVTASGAVLSAGLTSRGISVAISVPSAGRVMQQIKTTGGSTGTGILQMAQTNADMQRAQNHLNVFVQIAPDASTRDIVHDNALNALRSMRGAGVH